MSWLYSDQWAAGFFDGEGSVSIYRKQRGGYIEHGINVQVVQNDRQPLQEIQARYGGTISQNPANERCSRWRASGATAERFLRAIRPHSLVKRDKIRLALDLRALIGAPGHRLQSGIWDQREAIYREFYGKAA